MTKLMSCLFIAAAVVLGPCFAAAPAQAQLSRTFVSTAGNDANDCSQAAPCRTFQGAHDKTNPDGEITVLDPGGYGAVTITKSISIVNDGVGEASILVSGGATGITINGGAAAYVNLRGLTVQGIGFGGGSGLRFSSGFALTVTNCVFRSHTVVGFDFVPIASGTSNLAVLDTLVADNVLDGVRIAPSAPDMTVRVALDRVQVTNNGHTGIFINGFNATGTFNVAMTDSISANNATGIDVTSAAGKATTSVMVVRSVVANNSGFALLSGDAPTAILRVGQSAITGNGLVFGGNGPATLSFGDNYIAGNGDGDRAPPTIPRK